MADEDAPTKAPSSPQPLPRWMQWLGEWAKVVDVLAKIAIAVIVAWWSVTSFRIQQSSSEAALRATLDHQRAAVRSQREIDEAKLALSVVPLMKCKIDTQQLMALQIVQATAPGQATQLANILKECAQTPKERQLIERFTVQSARSEDAERFLQFLGDARQSKRYGLANQAASEYEQAYNALPKGTYPAKIDEDAIREAKRAREERRFVEAADYYERAFRRIETPEGVNALPVPKTR